LANILQFSFSLSYIGSRIFPYTFLSKMFNWFLSLFGFSNRKWRLYQAVTGKAHLSAAPVCSSRTCANASKQTDLPVSELLSSDGPELRVFNKCVSYVGALWYFN
jgi:hypothetical protein